MKRRQRPFQSSIGMAKNKRHKYERVRHLPNVIFSGSGEVPAPGSQPWYRGRFAGMEKVLELGCGKGEHSLGFAAANPGKLCVGIDRKSHRMCVGAEKALDLGLENVLFLRARIEQIKWFFVEQSIHEIWLTFPDPCPKTRTIKSRLSAPSFLDVYAGLLVPGGIVHLKTDSDMFFDYTRTSVERWGGREIAVAMDMHGEDFNPPAAGKVISAYENAALLRGTPIKYLAFELN
ncbi:MAG: tRNA (guanosine(46)-N7)-methyltransferase TrmB [Desulfobacteraceae bacterium]|nr:tRNA (guanosine(46)-N7)-methyltransferase TrmB [Desulfobacteraceae bacterium]